MSDEKKKDPSEKEFKKFFSNSFFSILYSYTVVISSIVTVFLLARILTPEEWGFILIATSIINIVTLVLSFLPPSLKNSINYYVTRYRTRDLQNKLRSFIKKSLILKMTFLIPFYLFSFILFYLFKDLFSFSLKNYTHLLILLSPTIIFGGIEVILNSLFRGFNKYNLIFFAFLIRKIIHIGGLLYFFFYLNNVSVELAVNLLVLSYLFQFIVNVIMSLIIYLKIPKSDDVEITTKKVFKKLFKYGSWLGVGDISESVRKETEVQMIGTFASAEWVTGYSMSFQLQGFVYNTIEALRMPLLNTFSSLHSQKKDEQVNSIFNLFFKYSTLFVCFLVASVFFVSDFIIVLLLGEPYLKYSIILKIILITLIFDTSKPPIDAYLKGFNKTKYLPYFSLLIFIFRLPLFIIGLVFFDLITAVVLGIFVAQILIFIGEVLITTKKFKISVKIRRILILQVLFFICLGLSFFLDVMVLKELEINIIKLLNIPYIELLQVFGLILFFLFFIPIIVILKLINKNEIVLLERFLPQKKRINKILTRFLNYFKKILRD